MEQDSYLKTLLKKIKALKPDDKDFSIRIAEIEAFILAGIELYELSTDKK